MDINKFKAGSIIKQPTGFTCFMPETVCHTFTWADPSINTLLEQAILQLGPLKFTIF